jgi:O6-methylguanine-DNA--protein-cysteine methyltransferase
VRGDGDLGNYGGGIERKEWLLAHERRHSRSTEGSLH